MKIYANIKKLNNIWETLSYIMIIKNSTEKRTTSVSYSLLDFNSYRIRNDVNKSLPEVTPNDMLDFLNDKLNYIQSNFYIESAKLNNVYNQEDEKKLKKLIKKIEIAKKERDKLNFENVDTLAKNAIQKNITKDL